MLGILQDAGNTVTLAGYLNLLGESGLVTGLQKFSMDTARKRTSIPKYQVYNNALLSASLCLSYKDAICDSKLWGQIYESAIGAYIVSEAFVNHFDVFYWRDGNDEVDFILKKNNKIIAIEAKSNSESYTAGIERFRNLYKPTATIIVGENGIKPETFLCMDLKNAF